MDLINNHVPFYYFSIATAAAENHVPLPASTHQLEPPAAAAEAVKPPPAIESVKGRCGNPIQHEQLLLLLLMCQWCW